MPDVPEYLQPVVSAVPLQLLAYHIALLRGCNVDKPRNLAKSVTVEESRARQLNSLRPRPSRMAACADSHS